MLRKIRKRSDRLLQMFRWCGEDSDKRQKDDEGVAREYVGLVYHLQV